MTFGSNLKHQNFIIILKHIQSCLSAGTLHFSTLAHFTYGNGNLLSRTEEEPLSLSAVSVIVQQGAECHSYLHRGADALEACQNMSRASL